MGTLNALGLSFFAGISTILGGIFYSQLKTISSKYFSYFLGLSAGAMIAISLFDLMPSAIGEIGIPKSLVMLLVGMSLAKLVDLAIPHHLVTPFNCDAEVKKMMMTGVMVSIGMIIHNIPEGMAVFMAGIHNFQLGSVLAIATAIHNIPEGIAIAAPIICATKNTRLALKYTVIAGLAEPFGALLTLLILKPFFTTSVLAGSFAMVAGIMLFISIDELIPWCFRDGNYRQAWSGMVSGVAILGLSLGIMGY